MLLTLGILCFCFLCKGQAPVLKKTILFNSGRSRINAADSRTLKNLLDSLSPDSNFNISLEGHSDNVGKYAINKRISQKRALSVLDDLVRSGVRRSLIEVTFRGPDSPVASNKTIQGRRANRRVDITVYRRLSTGAPPEVPDIALLYQQLETPAQAFCIDQTRDTVIRCRQGTVIYIKAHSITPTATCDDHCVTFLVREDRLPSDMILDNLSTTSNGELIETQGMIYTDAVDCKGNKLALEKDLTIVMPTDSINPTAKIFDGKRDHNAVMNWTVNNNSVLSNFSLPQLDYCSNFLCKGPEPSTPCPTCRFFFCRIGRLGKVVKGVFSSSQGSENRSFRACQAQALPQSNSESPVKDTAASCGRLQELFKKYGVTDLPALILVLNKHLLDSFKVNTIAQLQDTLLKIKRKNIELSYLNKKLSFEDYKYYVFNVSKFGWTNVDCFASFAADGLTTVKVNLAAARNIDCKLIFRNGQIIMPPAQIEGLYQFPGVPRGEKAFIVAIKYEDGRPFLALKEITIAKETFDVEFRSLTLEELKQELKKLDE